MTTRLRAPICLAMAAFCCRPAPADKSDQPPVATRKVEAEYPPEMAKSYVLENVSVRMAIGPDGAPFDLNAVGSLPDNVVRALEQWRFQPGTRDGQPASYAIGLNVPVRRPITRIMEFSLRRRWLTMDKEIKDAIKAGAALDAAGAAQLEQGLVESPASLRDRVTLLAYLANAPAAANGDEIRKARVKHIAWLVENLPDAAILDGPLALINAAG
ncbi:MAG: energy transducer TonB, partial [Bryobacteraceae bacterium]